MSPPNKSHRIGILSLSTFLLLCASALFPHPSTSFLIATPTPTHTHTHTPATTTTLPAHGSKDPSYNRSSSSPRYNSSPSGGARRNDRTKRQERVGHLVRAEIATVLQNGSAKNTEGRLDDDLRRRINVVNADVSPDLRQARVTVSVIRRPRTAAVLEREGEEGEEEDGEEDEEYAVADAAGDAVVDRRRAYAWLVRNSKQIRHSVAQRLSHMKGVPTLTFAQVDVGAAVDVMNLIDKVSTGDYTREYIGVYGRNDDELPEGMYLEEDEEEAEGEEGTGGTETDDDEEGDWEDDDDWVDVEDMEGEDEE